MRGRTQGDPEILEFMCCQLPSRAWQDYRCDRNSWECRAVDPILQISGFATEDGQVGWNSERRRRNEP